MGRRWTWACGWLLAAGIAASGCGDDDDGASDPDGGSSGSSGRGGSGRGGSGGSGPSGRDGGPPPQLSCDEFTPCGGDVVGSWQLTGVCFDGIEEAFAEIADMPGCEDFAELGSITPRGQYTFGDDGRLTVQNASFTVALELTLSAECARGIAGEMVTLSTAQCNAFAGSLGGTDTIAEATCVFAGGACECEATSTAMPLSGGGPYEVDGDELIQGADRSQFCVDGDRLSISTTSESMETGVLSFERR